jgi:hypothetical protein
MATMPVRHGSTRTREYSARPISDDRAEFVEAPESRTRGVRGLVTGVLLGAGLWGGILVSFGVIKL